MTNIIELYKKDSPKKDSWHHDVWQTLTLMTDIAVSDGPVEQRKIRAIAALDALYKDDSA